jgi:pimeloyl-ACP methyl ester carboxylesterase
MARRLRRWSVRLVVTLIALIAGLVCIGAIYRVIGNWQDAQRFQQRGRTIQAGPVKLNLDCTGQGNPTVVLESGSTIPALGWAMVQPEVAKFARVCSYDRAGYGWSEPGPEPRTITQIAKELKALLDAAGEVSPYVVVGHSLGGFTVRVFTSLYPNAVAAAVLVESGHPDQEKYLRAALSTKDRRQQERDQELQSFLVPWIIRLGVARLMWRDAGPQSLSRDLREEINYFTWQPKALHAGSAEMQAFEESSAEVRAAQNLGDRPLIVLTAAKSQLSYSLSGKAEEEQQRIWTEVLQAELARLSSRGKQIIVPDSGHMIPFEHPEAVVSAVHEVWSNARTSAR